MKNTIKLVLALFIFSSVLITSCKKVDFKDIIEKVRDDRGDKDKGDKDRGDKDKGDKDRGDKDEGDKDRGDGKGNDRDSTGRR
jgi:hypothetical protein